MTAVQPGQRKMVVIDAGGVRTVEEFWQRYVDAANPEEAGQFGRNLDAFWDAVERGGPGWPGEVDLKFIHMAELQKLKLSDGSPFLNAFETMISEAKTTKISVER